MSDKHEHDSVDEPKAPSAGAEKDSRSSRSSVPDAETHPAPESPDYIGGVDFVDEAPSAPSEGECKVYPGTCQCRNARCSHGVSCHESCFDCKRFIVVIGIPCTQSYQGSPAPSTDRAGDEHKVIRLAKWLCERLSAAQNITMEERGYCDDCFEDAAHYINGKVVHLSADDRRLAAPPTDKSAEESRSVQHRKAVQKGEPMPTFTDKSASAEDSKGGTR
jgi:hypothetical protein